MNNMNETPTLTRTREELTQALADLSGTRALVMTMGALHDGHLQLVREAQQLADHVVVTIFVNPTQFAPGEDFEAYPRTLDADMEALASVGADLVWAPDSSEVYLQTPSISVDPGAVAHILEGATRPTHFGGVALVVTKTFGIIRPDIALFGEKDAQQLAVIRTIVADLDIPVRIHGVPIVRDSDGVALSSRNQYLSTDERVRARALSHAIGEGASAAALGATPREIVDAARAVLAAEDVEIDYVALVDDARFVLLAGTDSAAGQVDEALSQMLLSSQSDAARDVRLLVAARVGATRLIDNAPMALVGGHSGE